MPAPLTSFFLFWYPEMVGNSWYYFVLYSLAVKRLPICLPLLPYHSVKADSPLQFAAVAAIFWTLTKTQRTQHLWPACRFAFHAYQFAFHLALTLCLRLWCNNIFCVTFVSTQLTRRVLVSGTRYNDSQTRLAWTCSMMPVIAVQKNKM